MGSFPLEGGDDALRSLGRLRRLPPEHRTPDCAAGGRYSKSTSIACECSAARMLSRMCRRASAGNCAGVDGDPARRGQDFGIHEHLTRALPVTEAGATEDLDGVAVGAFVEVRMGIRESGHLGQITSPRRRRCSVQDGCPHEPIKRREPDYKNAFRGVTVNHSLMNQGFRLPHTSSSMIRLNT